MGFGSWIQVRGIIVDAHFLPAKEVEKARKKKASPDEIEQGHKTVEVKDENGNTVTYMKKVNALFRASLRMRNPENAKWTMYWNWHCYGKLAEVVQATYQEGDIVIVQGDPAVRVYPPRGARNFVLRIPCIVAHSVYPASRPLTTNKVMKQLDRGRVQFEYLSDEELGLA